MIRSGYMKLAEKGRLRIVILLSSFSQNKNDRKCNKISIAPIMQVAVSSGTKKIHNGIYIIEYHSGIMRFVQLKL